MLEIKRTGFSSTSPTWGRYGTQVLETDAVSLLTGPAMEEPTAVSKHLWILLHNTQGCVSQERWVMRPMYDIFTEVLMKITMLCTLYQVMHRVHTGQRLSHLSLHRTIHQLLIAR